MNTSWPTLTEAVFACEKCRLCQTRTNVVLGEGDLHAPLMFIGEGPGQQEDLSGRPFVGAAGQLLDKMLAAIGLKREQVYICNIVKCRPPQNRVPEPDERAACMDYLRQQVALVRPKVIVCLGSTPTRALLRDADKKRPAWVDFQAIRDKLIELNAYPGETEAG